MINETGNANNAKTTKVRVTRLEEACSDTYICDLNEYACMGIPRSVEVTCSGNSFSCSFIVGPKDQIYQVGDIIEITYRKC